MVRPAKTVAPGSLSGTVAAPPSKSVFQRAAAVASLAGGTSLLLAAGPLCADARASLRAARGLGARVESRGGAVKVTGRALEPEGTVDCGESGLALRMFASLAALGETPVTLTGSGSLLGRPVHMIPPALEALGASCRTREGYPPLRVEGPLRGGRVEVDGSLTSQVLSGLLLALPACRQDSEIRALGLRSRGYVRTTLEVMDAFGVRVEADFDSLLFRVRGGQSYQAREYAVEGDWSGASFLLAAGALAGPVTVTGLDLQSSQPDRAILEVLERVGARVIHGEGAVSVEPGVLAGFWFDATDCPDLFPVLAVLAAFCRGRSMILGAGRLRHKESDRAAVLARELARLGAGIRIEGEAMVLEGGGLEGGEVDSRGDHRIAMAAAVAGLAARGPVRIHGTDCAAKSYPRFFEDLAFLGARVE